MLETWLRDSNNISVYQYTLGNDLRPIKNILIMVTITEMINILSEPVKATSHLCIKCEWPLIITYSLYSENVLDYYFYLLPMSVNLGRILKTVDLNI